MPKTISRILLSHTQWDKQELLDRLTDSDKRVDLFAKAHVVYPLPQKVQVKDSNDDDKVECGICLGEMPRTVNLISQCSQIFLVSIDCQI